MYKKLMITALLCISGSYIQTSVRKTPPYENLIASEYNRMRAGINWYRSMGSIIYKPSRGLTIDERNENIADLQALKLAVQTAIQKAENEGRPLWYYAYIWKDTSPAIDTLRQYIEDIDDKLAEYAQQSQSDLEKFARYAKPYVIGAVVAITALWLSQGFYLREGEQPHGFFEMHAAPVVGAFNATKYVAAQALAAGAYTTGLVKNISDYAAAVQSPTPPIPPQA
jgi:hypothetical protein